MGISEIIEVFQLISFAFKAVAWLKTTFGPDWKAELDTAFQPLFDAKTSEERLNAARSLAKFRNHLINGV